MLITLVDYGEVKEVSNEMLEMRNILKELKILF